MAQWNGQYSGLTHETKVQDIEESLRLAVAAFDVASDSQRPAKAKAIHHLAERLLAARSKALRARLPALREPGAKRTTSDQAAQLQARDHELHAQGVAGILREFHFHDPTVA